MSPIKTNVSLKNYSNFKIGGNASFFLEISSKEDIVNAVGQWNKTLSKSNNQKQIFILGGGTNLLFSDKGFDGLIIKNSITGIQRTSNGIKAGAGESISNILRFCIQNSLSGLEWAGGLPGTIGGAVRGNAGAFKGEIKDNVDRVETINIITLETQNRNNAECEFDYRSSVFKTTAIDEMIISIELKLISGDKAEIEKLTQEKIDYRNQKHPMDLQSIGSTFKNVQLDSLTPDQKNDLMQFVKDDPFPVIPVAKLLYLSGVKGKRAGDAQISEKHPNFIVNLGNATDIDVIKLIEFAKEAVKQKFNIALEEEIIYV